MPLVEKINYFDFVSETLITIFIFILLVLLSKTGEPKSIINISMIGFLLLYFSMLTDVFDEIFYNPVLITNIVENVFQVIGYIIICIGLYQWLDYNNKNHVRLMELSSLDTLTGMLNRRAFLERAYEEIERSKRYNIALSVIMLDIDFFKKVNDKYGHNTGDEVLRKISNNISLQLRKNDILCRWGGEEFLLLIPEIDKESGKKISDKIRLYVSEHPVEIKNGLSVNITISIGCTSLTESDNSIESIIERADHALYQSKRNGRNIVTIS